MNIAIGRHNGIGDLVMLLPIIGRLKKDGHKITVFTHSANHKWFQWICPGVDVSNCDKDPYTDYRQTMPKFDHYINCNRVEHADYITIGVNGIPVNQQQVYCLMSIIRGLSYPIDLSPSAWVNLKELNRDQGVMVFSKATHQSRTLSQSVVDKIIAKYPGCRIDVPFNDKIDLTKAIQGASLVIGSDSGAIHLAEAVSTPWICLHTTMDSAMRHKFYKHGVSIQSTVSCSPCRNHDGCSNIICTSNFNLENIDG